VPAFGGEVHVTLSADSGEDSIYVFKRSDWRALFKFGETEADSNVTPGQAVDQHGLAGQVALSWAVVGKPPVIASVVNDSSSNSSKDEGKYIFLFVCVGFVLGGLVAAALYAAGCIGSKAGADVSALPTKPPVQAVEFTTVQETA